MVHMGKDITSKGLWPPPRVRCLRWARKVSRNFRVGETKVRYLVSVFPQIPRGTYIKVGVQAVWKNVPWWDREPSA